MKELFLGCILIVLLMCINIKHDLYSLNEKVDDLKEDIIYCEWDRSNHTLRVIKGTKTAERARRQIGKPSDKGGC